MRRSSLLLALFACACSDGPGALGITGPNPTGDTPLGNYGALKLPSALSGDDATVQPPGNTPIGAGTTYAPSIAPTYGENGRYYGQ